MLTELMIISFFFLGLLALGYLACVIWPPESLRQRLGLAGEVRPHHDNDGLRAALRFALRAPDSASDPDLLHALFELRHEALRRRSREGADA